MNERLWLKRLAQRSREERVPEIDVSTAVAETLSRQPGAVNVPLAAVALASAVGATIMVLFLGESWLIWDDPFVNLFTSLDVVPQ